MSSSAQLASILRCLLSLIEQRPTNFLCRDILQNYGGNSLKNLTKSTFHEVGVSGLGSYSLLLLREIILSTFKVFCLCVEVDQDIQYCYSELKNICEAVEEFNQLLSNTSQSSSTNGGVLQRKKTSASPLSPVTLTENVSSDWTIEFADLADVYVKTHTTWITSIFFKNPTLVDILHLSKFESSFSRALLGTVATYTSIIKTTSITGASQKMEYVSDEMFSATSSDDKITWLDCLIPGAQSETLRLVHRDISGRLWRKVAENLITQVHQVLLFDSWALEEYIPHLSLLSQHPDLESYSVVVSCIKHVVSSIYQKHTLHLWDTAFQKLVVSSLGAYRKGFKIKKSNTLSPLAAGSEVLTILDNYASKQIQGGSLLDIKSCKSVLEHVNCLKCNLLLCFATRASIRQMSTVLLKTFGNNMSSWNLVSLAQLVFQDAPITAEVLGRSVSISISASSPQMLFPLYISLHGLTRSNRDACSSLHEVNTFLQDSVMDFYGHFQDIWARKCAKVLMSTFPPFKYWKNHSVNRRQVRESVPCSSYCEIILEHLFLPIVNAAVILPEGPQNFFIHLMVTVFYNEYRKIITSKQKLYNTSAGRQLLTDHRYLYQWLTSQQLSKSTLKFLATAPIMTEFEEGLMVICGTADVDHVDSSSSVIVPMEDSVFRNHKYFPVYTEVAWNLMADWKKCIA